MTTRTAAQTPPLPVPEPGRQGEAVAFRALEMTGIDAEGIRAAIREARPPAITPLGHIPFTRELKRALDNGLRESLKLSHNYIGTEHLLLGLMADCGQRPDSPCWAPLKAFDVEPDGVREAVMALLCGYGEVLAAAPADRDGEAVDCRSELLGRLDDIARQVQAMRRQLGGY